MKIIQILDKNHRRLTLGISMLFVICLGLAKVASFLLEILPEVKLPFPVLVFAGGALTFIIYKECVRDSRL